VTAALQPAPSAGILLNGKSVEMAPVRSVLEAIAPEPVLLQFETRLPLGCGFGVSAACCLTAAFAISRRYDLGLSRGELGLLAHEAEVIHRTGLGDVAAQLCGGIVNRTCRQGPLDAERLPLPPGPLYYRVYSAIRTSEVLNNPTTVKKIAEEGDNAIDWLQHHLSDLTLKDLLSRSLQFVKKVGLLTNENVRRAIELVHTAGGQATMIMLGESVLATCPCGDGGEWTRSEVNETGTRWLP
jgi:pantoate kinase